MYISLPFPSLPFPFSDLLQRPSKKNIVMTPPSENGSFDFIESDEGPTSAGKDGGMVGWLQESFEGGRLQTLWHELACGAFLTMIWIRSRCFRALPLWKYYNSYFPITFQRKIPLDAHKNYIFGYHGKGGIEISAWACFATDDGKQVVNLVEGKFTGAGGFGTLFPGIRNTLLMGGDLRLPLGRVSEQTCERLLRGTSVGCVSRSSSSHPSKTIKTSGWPFSSRSPSPPENSGWTRGSTIHYYINPLTWWFFIIDSSFSMVSSLVRFTLHLYTRNRSVAMVPQGNAITIPFGDHPNRDILKIALRIPNTQLVPVISYVKQDSAERGTWLEKLPKGIKRWFERTVVLCGPPVTPERWSKEYSVEELAEPTMQEVDKLSSQYAEGVESLCRESGKSL